MLLLPATAVLAEGLREPLTWPSHTAQFEAV